MRIPAVERSDNTDASGLRRLQSEDRGNRTPGLGMLQDSAADKEGDGEETDDEYTSGAAEYSSMEGSFPVRLATAMNHGRRGVVLWPALSRRLNVGLARNLREAVAD